MRLAPCALALAACGGGGGFLDAGVGGGTMAFSWKLVDANQQPLTCTQIGAEAVQVTIHIAGGGSVMETFACGVAMASSQQLQSGTYTVDFTLTAATTVLATLSAPTAIVIANGASVPVPATIPVDATGGLDLHLATGATAGNCAPSASGGAGITGTTIALRHNDTGPCAPVTFAIAPGATQPGATYTVDCATPVVGPCIEADQAIDATGLVSGRYTIEVHATTGAAASCWTTQSSLEVPPLSHVLATTLPLTPGC